MRTEGATGLQKMAAAALAVVLGGVGGYAAVFLGSPGLVLGGLVIGLTAVAYSRRGWTPSLAWILVGAGLVPAAILSPAVLNTDPAVHYARYTFVALAVSITVLLVGLAWAIALGRRH